MLQMMESCIKQNNGIDIYLEYFTDQDEVTLADTPRMKTVALFRDPEQIDGHIRPVSDISFKLDGEKYL